MILSLFILENIILCQNHYVSTDRNPEMLIFIVVVVADWQSEPLQSTFFLPQDSPLTRSELYYQRLVETAKVA